MRRLALIVAAIASLCGSHPARAADAAFTQFIASLWPEAQAAGVSRATFDRETAGLKPDYKLPDLILPGRPPTGAPSQAEFVQVPADYIKEAAIARLAEHHRRHAFILSKLWELVRRASSSDSQAHLQSRAANG